MLGIGDDCAILRPPSGHEIVVTTDFSLEGRHFTRTKHPAASAGHRCLARGLSDLAAMGASPLAAFLSLALPDDLLASRKGEAWLAGFLDGLGSLASESRTPVAGGDTSSSPNGLCLAGIVLVGSAPAGQALRRSGARPGDAIYVTGSLGGAHAELTAVLERRRPSTANATGDHPHLFPRPRLAVGRQLLRRRLANAAIDLSDGLSTDLAHLCSASKVRAEIDAALLPLHPLTEKLTHEDALHAALNGGEDYELLFTASPGIKMRRSLGGVPITRIGTVHRVSAKKPQVTLVNGTTASGLKPGGWQHLTGT